MSEDLNFAESIVNHDTLSTNDLVNTLLIYFATLPQEPTFDQYELCKPALVRIYEEDQVAFTRVARKIKECFDIPLYALSADMKALSAGLGNGQTGPRESQADLLVALTKDLVLFHDGLRDPYAAIQVDGHQEIWRCRSKAFRRYVVYRFFQHYGKAPSNEAQSSALAVIEGKALFEGKQYPLHNRVAWHEDAIWYDLSDSSWRAVKITAQGWAIVSHPPILFRRYAHQAPQVAPLQGGTLALLDQYVNLTESARKLLKVTLCTYLIPDIPHPGLHPHGEQGAGKSSLLRVLRQLVDPSQVPLLSFPRDIAELAQQLSHHYCPFYDNVSTISPWISNALCRAVTGEGFTKRELYSDDEDVIYTFRRCLGLNGINIAATAPDMLDRLVLIEMSRIEEKHRQEEKTLWAKFEQDKPRILGTIFDALVSAMKIKPKVLLTHRPRMADYAVWGEAISRGLGCKAGEFIALYKANIQGQHQEVVRGHTVAAAIVELMEERETWEGTATDLFKELAVIAEKIKLDVKEKDWPKAPNALTRRLKEVLSNLREVGITVSFADDEKKRSKIRLEKSEEKPPEPPEHPNPSDSEDLGAGDTSGDTEAPKENLRNTSDENIQKNQGFGDSGDSGDIFPPFSGQKSDYKAESVERQNPRGRRGNKSDEDALNGHDDTEADPAKPRQPLSCQFCRRPECPHTPWGWYCHLSDEDKQRWAKRAEADDAEASRMAEEERRAMQEEAEEKNPEFDLHSGTDEVPRRPCSVCRRTNWWQNSAGAWVCGVCHPDPLATVH